MKNMGLIQVDETLLAYIKLEHEKREREKKEREEKDKSKTIPRPLWRNDWNK